MDTTIKQDEQQELVEIYRSLSAPLKKQLMTLARVIDTTQEIALNEAKGKNEKTN